MNLSELRGFAKGKLIRKTVGLLTISMIVFNLTYWISVQFVHQEYLEKSKSMVMQRIALDLPNLPIANQWLNKQADPEAVEKYIDALNVRMQSLGWPLEVLNITTFDEVMSRPSRVSVLNTMEQKVYVHFNPEYKGASHGFNLIPTFFALLLTWLYLYREICRDELAPLETKLADSPLLLSIDLNNKVMRNPKNGAESSISNKPLCFYCALVEYCIKNPDSTLNSSKELPEELLLLSQKYFYRLIELGHTIRKRPNFESNLDKTLSEIRAALDEVVGGDAKAKDILVPPKAIGEGSRSKVHNFGLSNLVQEAVEIVGK